MAKMTMVQALNLALQQEMEKDDSVIVLGEDVGVDGGVFRVTDGLINQFGDQRVLDTPLAESAIVGMSVGMAVYGLKPVCEILCEHHTVVVSGRLNTTRKAVRSIGLIPRGLKRLFLPDRVMLGPCWSAPSGTRIR